ADPARHQLRRRGVDLGTPGPVGGRDRPGGPDPPVRRRGTRRRSDHRHRPGPGGAMTQHIVAGYEIDDDPGRIDAGAAAVFLTTEAYWARWRDEPEIRR